MKKTRRSFRFFMTAQAKGLTQEFFSVISSRMHISRLENGRKKPFVVTINELAMAMEVHPLTLLSLSYLNENPEVDITSLQKIVLTELESLKLVKK